MYSDTKNYSISLLAIAVGLLLAVCATSPLSANVADESEMATLQYNGFAVIRLASPADTCLENEEDEHCFIVRALDGGELAGLQFPVEQISVPQPQFRQLVAGRHGGDFGWFVYDLERRDYVLSPAQKDEVLQVWQERGLAPPQFIDALEASDLFEQPHGSFDLMLNLLRFIAGLVAALACILFIMLALALWLWRRRLSQSRRESLTRILWILAVTCALAWIALLLSLLLWSGT